MVQNSQVSAFHIALHSQLLLKDCSTLAKLDTHRLASSLVPGLVSDTEVLDSS